MNKQRYYRQQKGARERARESAKTRKKELLNTLKKVIEIRKENPDFSVKQKDLKTEKSIYKKVGKEHKRVEKAKRIRKKRDLLSKFFDLSFVSDTRIDKVTFKDIETNNFPSDKYKFLYDKSDGKVNFNRVYTTKNEFVFAYRDFKNETDIGDLLRKFSKFKNDELLDLLQKIIRKPPTAIQGKTGTSGGSAGEALIYSGKHADVFIKDIREKNQRGKKAYDAFGKLYKKRQHSDFYSEFQFLESKGTLKINVFTLRNLLIFCNAIMYNTTELDRTSFYMEFYSRITDDIPDAKFVFPSPPNFYSMI